MQNEAVQRWWGPRLPADRLDAREARRTLILCGLIVVYALAAQLVINAVDYRGATAVYGYAKYTSMLLVVSFGIGGAVHLAKIGLIEREPRPSRRLYRDFREHFLTQDRFVSVMLPLLFLPLFVPAFLNFKSMIPTIQPFAWDEILMRVDRALHFGVDPWRITHALAPSPWISYVINILYNMWFMLIWAFAFYFVIRSNRPADRFQYLITLLLCWILLGTVLATVFSSAGPCYYGRVVAGADPYMALMARLQDGDRDLMAVSGNVRIWALQVQETLWGLYASGNASSVGGISAFPSLHVSLSTLMALGAWRLSRPLGWTMAVYAAAIMFGSVHLGWHYAIDGYASIAGTFAIWHGVGWAMHRYGLDDAPVLPVA